ncbi:MAG: hypothetical protein KKD44_04435 [Proteobacteria bacterium]|nr:hypothetical protein [Pseudomonadota bacterium]
MEALSKDVIEQRKKAIFDSMGKRGQKRIVRQGYDQWDPFQEPKDPLDIRKDITKRTIHELVHEFLQTRREETSSVSFGEGVFEMALALMNNNDKYRGMFEFSLWYADLLKKEGSELE